MTWSGFPLSEGDNLQDLSYYTQLVEALNERRTLITGYGKTSLAALATPTAGTNGQVAVKTGSWSADVFSWNQFQQAIQLTAGHYSPPPPSNNISASSFTPSYGSSGPLLNTFYIDAGLNSAGFIRKYPREITSVSEGGSSGQRARHVNTLVYYDHNGTSWQESSDQASAPDTITAYGRAREGDYLGVWLFNEAYAALNAIRYVYLDEVDTGFYTRAGTRIDAATGDDTTLAGAIAEAKVNFDAATPSSYTGSFGAWYAGAIWNDNSGSASDYFASPFKMENTSVDVTVLSPYTANVYGYTTLFDPPDALGGPNETLVFDPSIATAGAFTSGNIFRGPDLAAQTGTIHYAAIPDQYPADPTSTYLLSVGDSESRGFTMGSTDVILDFAVTGGFSYRP